VLAVLDGAAVVGTGPVPKGSLYECTSCSAGAPLRYFAFPPSEINAASGVPYNALIRLRITSGELEAYTRESDLGAPVAEMVFRLSEELDLLQARASDSWGAHDALERAGKLDHTVADCPMYRQTPAVREWSPDSGWRDVAPRDEAVVRASLTPPRR
jgi:hypothetical protein